MAAPIPHRFLLVRCDVENARQERSLRYVEHGQFRLWQYLMANKHGIVVTSAALGLWLPEDEWQPRAELFARAGEAEPVTRLYLELFDPTTGLCDVVQRFVPTPDLDLVSQRLDALLPADVWEQDLCVKTVLHGRAINRTDSVALESIGRRLALAD